MIGRDKLLTSGCEGVKWWGHRESWCFLPWSCCSILEELKSWISPKGRINLKNRQMTVSNKSNKVEESGSERVGSAGATVRPSEMITELSVRLCRASVCKCNAAVKVAFWEVFLSEAALAEAIMRTFWPGNSGIVNGVLLAAEAGGSGRTWRCNQGSLPGFIASKPYSPAFLEIVVPQNSLIINGCCVYEAHGVSACLQWIIWTIYILSYLILIQLNKTENIMQTWQWESENKLVQDQPAIKGEDWSQIAM